jgi:hypothetical protein
MRKNDKWPKKVFSVFSSVQFNFYKLYIESNPGLKTGYLDFMKNVSHTLLLGSDMELSTIPPSPESMELASTVSSSMQLPHVFHQKEPLQKTPHFG